MAASKNSNTASAPGAPRQELTMTRAFEAPREVVFKAWTDPKHLKDWWGPKGFTTPVCEADPRPGGAIRIHMRGPDGMVYPMRGEYREVVEPERLVFNSEPLDDKGAPMFAVLHTLTFEKQGQKTKMTMHAQVIMATAKAPQYLAGMEMGWNQSLDRLGAYVGGL